MRNKVLYFLFVVAFLAGTSVFADGGTETPLEIAGRYVGVLRHENLKRDQLVQMDILVSNEGDEDRHREDHFEFMAFLKLQFGDWTSSEYMTYHFDDIRLNLSDKSLPLAHPDQEVSVILKLTEPGVFTGIFRSNYGGNIGEVILRKEGSVPQKYPLMGPVAGEYEGVCADGVQQKLQIVTFRNTDDTTKIGNPFSSYRIHANWGVWKDPLCIDSAEYCLMGVFDKGTYNFFDDDLVLMGPRKTVKCQTTLDGLTCLKCNLKRIQKEPNLSVAQPKTIEQIFPNRPAIQSQEISQVAGVYRGYVYHEYMGTYQRAELNIQTFFQPGEEKEGEVSMSAVAHLYFGEYAQREVISYRFATRNFPIHQKPIRFSFQRPQADLDAVLHVEEIGDGFIRGTWYSLLFGRVGPFEMRKEGDVTIDPQLPIVKSLGGFYQGPLWDLNLLVELGQTPYNSDNPFHPLTFSGWAKIRNLGFRVSVLDGSYDIYTGKLGFILSDGSDILGLRDLDGAFKLKKVGHLFGTPLKKFDFEPYPLVSSEHPF